MELDRITEIAEREFRYSFPFRIGHHYGSGKGNVFHIDVVGNAGTVSCVGTDPHNRSRLMEGNKTCAAYCGNGVVGRLPGDQLACLSRDSGSIELVGPGMRSNISCSYKDLTAVVCDIDTGGRYLACDRHGS